MSMNVISFPVLSSSQKGRESGYYEEHFFGARIEESRMFLCGTYESNLHLPAIFSHPLQAIHCLTAISMYPLPFILT
ncbi:hypothetical protein MKX03_020128 [Papaver bracteatum]|nr:hypothetical protein MKX03_020128 [Papaver bracteatum]